MADNHAYTMVSKERWAAAVERLRLGYVDKSGNGYGPAILTAQGCVLAQKQPNRALHGYVQIAPVVMSRVQAKAPAQLAHRIVCYLHKPAGDVDRLLHHGYHASHLCHQPTCINPDHLVVESKALNELRKECRPKMHVRCFIDGRAFVLPDTACPHVPHCIIAEVERVTVAL